MSVELLTIYPAKWKNGTMGATIRELGKGKAIAVGTLPATSYMRSGLERKPWARGGRHTLFYPDNFSNMARNLTWLGAWLSQLENGDMFPVYTAHNVESIVVDHKDGTLVTLVNWGDIPWKNMEVRVRVKVIPTSVHIVSQQRRRPLEFTVKDGVVTFRLDPAEADYVVLRK